MYQKIPSSIKNYLYNLDFKKNAAIITLVTVKYWDPPRPMYKYTTKITACNSRFLWTHLHRQQRKSENANCNRNKPSPDRSTFPKDRHHTQFQTHAQQLKCSCTIKQLHTRNVRQRSITERERQRGGHRGEERGGMERFVLSTETSWKKNRLSHG